jgi:hypothetical protein
LLEIVETDLPWMLYGISVFSLISYGNVILNSELGEMRKNAVAAYFEAQYQLLLE